MGKEIAPRGRYLLNNLLLARIVVQKTSIGTWPRIFPTGHDPTVVADLIFRVARFRVTSFAVSRPIIYPDDFTDPSSLDNLAKFVEFIQA
jgi:hypothetical protein